MSNILSAIFNVGINFYYEVPFAKKDDAKKAGMRWDPSSKLWYASYDWGNLEQMEEDLIYNSAWKNGGNDKYCNFFNENLFNFKFRFFKCAWDFEDEDIERIQSNYAKQEKEYLKDKNDRNIRIANEGLRKVEASEFKERERLEKERQEIRKIENKKKKEEELEKEKLRNIKIPGKTYRNNDIVKNPFDSDSD